MTRQESRNEAIRPGAHDCVQLLLAQDEPPGPGAGPRDASDISSTCKTFMPSTMSILGLPAFAMVPKQVAGADASDTVWDE